MVRLNDVKVGSSVRVRSINRVDYKFTLYNMGLLPGSRVRVVFNDRVSIVVVDVEGVLVALSSSLAEHIDVDILEGGGDTS